MTFEPAIDPAVWRLRPDYVALSLIVRNARNRPSDTRDAAMLEAAAAEGAYGDGLGRGPS